MKNFIPDNVSKYDNVYDCLLYTSTFKVNESVLIPRQDTETLVEDAISIIRENKLRGEDLLPKKKKEFDVLDLCCGSGAIGLSLASLCDNVKVTCSDISREAIAVAEDVYKRQ